MTYLVTFFTHSGAIHFSRQAKAAGMALRMLPIPREVSSSCGTGVRLEADRPPFGLADEEVDRIYRAEGGRYTPVCPAPEPPAPESGAP